VRRGRSASDLAVQKMWVKERAWLVLVLFLEKISSETERVNIHFFYTSVSNCYIHMKLLLAIILSRLPAIDLIWFISYLYF